MKTLTLPLSTLLCGQFYFSPTLRGGNIYLPKNLIVARGDGFTIKSVQVGSDDQYRVFYGDGSNLKFGQDEMISVLV